VRAGTPPSQEVRSTGRSFTRYTSRVRFEWDPEKEARNFRKHGVSFVEARTVFGDALAATIPDSKHSELEQQERRRYESGT